MKKNVAVLGFVIGAITPVAGMFIVYFLLFHNYSFADFWRALTHNHDITAKVVTMSILLNLVPFLLYSNRRLDETAKGVLIATSLYAVFILLLKFVWN